jgi:hypothetical protein
VNGEAVDPLTPDGVCGEVVCEGLPQLATLSHHRTNLGHLCSLSSTGSSSSSSSSRVSSNSSTSRHQTAMSGNTNIRSVFVYTTPQNRTEELMNRTDQLFNWSPAETALGADIRQQCHGTQTFGLCLCTQHHRTELMN